MILDDLAEGVTDHATLSTFVEALAENLERHPDEWGNRELPQFLDALSRFVGSMDSWARNNHVQLPEDPRWWSLVAELLLIAREYE